MSPELENIRREMERLTNGQPTAAWQQAPAGKWTCAQIAQHLLLSYTATTKGLLKGLELGAPLTRRSTWRDRVRTFAVTKIGFMPAGRPSPPHTAPHEGLEVDSMRRFYDALVAMDATLADGERRFGRRAKLLDHPDLGPLNAAEWRRFHLTHARHHFKQIAERLASATPRPRDREFTL